MMLIVWGFRPRNSTIGTGVFHCAREGGDRNYEHKRAKRWFTLFWIPLIPLNDLGEFIECTSCGSTYYPDVIENKTAAEMEDIATIAIRHVAAAMLLADGQVVAAEREAALAMVARFASRPYDSSDLDTDLETLERDELSDRLHEFGAILNEHGRESVLTAAVYLAGSDGTVDRSELAAIYEMGEALTMSRAHVEGVISTELSRLGLAR